MLTPSLLSRFGRPAIIAAFSVLLPLSAQGSTVGSVIEGSTGGDNGSTVSTIDASGSASASGTTSYDAPTTYDLGGIVTLATAILNGGTVTNGTISASTAITGYSGSVIANLTGAAALTKSTSDTLVLAGTNSYSGGTTISGGTLQIGDGGSRGTLSGNVTNDATLVFNRADDYSFTGVISGSGDVAINDGILRFTQAQTYTGTTTINSGYLVLTPNSDQGLSASTKVHVASGAFFDISNRAQTIASLTGGGTVYSFGGNSGSLTIGTAASERQTFSGTLGGSFPDFAVAKTGQSTLVLSGANTYSGNTDVMDGTLLVNGSLGNTSVTVYNGGVLGGTGTINGPTTIQSGGILAPGDSVGTLTFASGLTFNAGSMLSFDLGTTSDLLLVTNGFLTGPASGNVTVNLTNAGGLAQATYTILTFTGATLSDFNASDFVFGTTPAGWNYSFGLTADSLQITVVASAVPEPATYAALAGLAALGMALRRRLRRNAI